MLLEHVVVDVETDTLNYTFKAVECVFSLCACVYQIAGDIKAAKRELKKARTVLQMDELKCRKRVLRRLGFATSSDVIEMKGRVACEISR